MGQRITERIVKSLTIPKTGNRIIYDNEIPGFGVRMTAAGVVSFVLNYHARGRERRYTIGRHPELSVAAAHDEAIGLRELIRSGGDPLEEKHKERAAPTVADLLKISQNAMRKFICGQIPSGLTRVWPVSTSCRRSERSGSRT